MERMFLKKTPRPNDKMLSEVLGPSYEYWKHLKTILQNQYAGLAPEWKYYGAKSGWAMKMMLKKRNLFFVGPCDGYFRIAFVFGDKAVKAIEESDLPLSLIKEVQGAKRYAEGRGLRIECRGKEHIEDVLKLTAIKVRN